VDLSPAEQRPRRHHVALMSCWPRPCVSAARGLRSTRGGTAGRVLCPGYPTQVESRLDRTSISAASGVSAPEPPALNRNGWADSAVAHVLLVEDEMLLAQVFQAALEDEGHRVTAAGDGVAALSADALDPAEVLVTDLRMPRMGGRELVAHLRERRPDLPVVVLSGYAVDAGGIGGGDAAVGATVC
jgi:hypothetical protein